MEVEPNSLTSEDELELDLERLQEFLRELSAENKTIFKRILKFSKLGLNGKRASSRASEVGGFRAGRAGGSVHPTTGVDLTTSGDY